MPRYCPVRYHSMETGRWTTRLRRWPSPWMRRPCVPGLGRDRIYNAIRDGDLVAKKFGRRTLITADALRRFLDGLPPLRLPSA